MVVLGVALVTLGGCRSAERERTSVESLRYRSERVERNLLHARDKSLSSGGIQSGVQIGHLTTLRLALSAANISLAAVETELVKPEHRAVAYSVLDEAYGTIDWNIPILPGQGQRALPGLFAPQSGGLNFNAIRQGLTPQSFASPGVLPEQLGASPNYPVGGAGPLGTPGFAK